MKQERAADAAQIQTPFPPRFSPYRRKCNNFSPSALQLLASDASFLTFEAGPNVAPHDSFTLPYPWHRFSSSYYLSPSLHSSETRKKGAVGELKAHSDLLPLHLLHLLFRSHLLRSVFTPFLFHPTPLSPSRGGRNIHSFKLGAHAGEEEDCTHMSMAGGRLLGKGGN